MGLLGMLFAAPAPAQADLVVDDFLTPGVSTLKTPWEGYTDRVMGGLTRMVFEWRTEDGRGFLRLQGRVRTENNGGFLQMRVPVALEGRTFDARPWTGVSVTVRGSPGSYAVHLRTAQNWFPWNFFTTSLAVTEAWTEVRFPFAGFQGAYGASGSPDLRTLKSVALVAIGEAFEARLDVALLSFYR